MSIWVLLGPISMVCIIALAMAIFAPLGSEAYGRVADKTSFVQNFTLMGLMGLVTLIVVLSYRGNEYQRAERVVRRPN
jgi:uncharacterized membrane protein